MKVELSGRWDAVPGAVVLGVVDALRVGVVDCHSNAGRLQAPSRRRRDAFHYLLGGATALRGSVALSLIWGVSFPREKATADYQLRLLLQYAFGQNNYGQIGLGFAEPSTTVIRAPMSSSAVWGAVASYPPGISKLPVDRWCEQKDCEAVVGRDALCTVCQGDWRRFV